jgi:hypothetical protein
LIEEAGWSSFQVLGSNSLRFFIRVNGIVCPTEHGAACQRSPRYPVDSGYELSRNSALNL